MQQACFISSISLQKDAVKFEYYDVVETNKQSIFVMYH